MDKSQEQELISKCQADDLNSFGLLYDAYIEKIFNFIYFRTNSKEVAEDLTSQTFFKALKNINNFKGEYFSAWLFKIARNTVIDHYRTNHPTESIEDFFSLKIKEDLEQEADNRKALQEVKKLLTTFKPEHQDIVIMRVWEELSYKEIAQILGKSEASCKMIFSRTINSLREQIPLTLFLILLLNY